MTRVIVDAGPIVSLLVESDRSHAWARDVFAEMREPMYTCESVISEASHLMRRRRGGPAAVLELVANGVIALAFHVEAELASLQTLVQRYASVPMSIADACLVRMSEISPNSTILTLDSDFRIYRRNGRQAIPVIMPGSR